MTIARQRRRFRYQRSPVAQQRVDVHRHAPLLDGARAIVARRRRRRARSDYRTLLLGLLALLTTGGVAAGELARVWQRGAAPLPADTEDVLGAAEEAARQTVEVAVAGYREGSRAEATLLGVLASFTVTLGAVRGATHLIHSHGPLGPLRNLTVGRRHIHHFVPGIALAFIAGGASIVFPRGRFSPWLALPFGTGLALTLDESALLLDLDDVYWTEEGIISVQIALGALGMLSALVLVLRLLRRGESTVLDAPVSGEHEHDPVVLSLVPNGTPQKPLGLTGLADEGGA
jgi:hypothetical protein